MERTDIDIPALKERLLAEKKQLEEQLNSVGTQNPKDPKDWVPTEDVSDAAADQNVVADHVESFNENVAVTADLETRINNVDLALEKIEKGTYGICEISGNPIEADRLEANPAARTDKAHMDHDLR